MAPSCYEYIMDDAPASRPTLLESGSCSDRAIGEAKLPITDEQNAPRHDELSWRQKWTGVIPGIFVVVTWWYCSWAETFAREGKLEVSAKESLRGLFLTLTLWGITSYLLADRGAYVWLLEHGYQPGWYLPVVPLAIALGYCWLVPQAGHALLVIAVIVPLDSPLNLQCIRFLAIVSLIKWRLGLFPPSVAKILALPDFIYGFTTCILRIAMFCGMQVSRDFLGYWYVIGFLVIWPFGHIAINFDPKDQFPPTRVFLQLPTALGPSFAVMILTLGTNSLMAYAYLIH